MKTQKELSLEDLGTRQKIMEAAIVLFAKEGLHGVSTRDIAKASGLNLSLISYYFGGKEGLYKSCIQEFTARIFTRIEGVVDEFEQQGEVSAKSIQKAIHQFVQSLIEMRTANPHMAKIMTREKLEGMPYCREIQEEMLHNAGEKLTTIITRGQKAGIVHKSLNPHFFIICIVEGILGYFNLYDCKCSWNKELYQLPEEKDPFFKQISLFFLEGILK